MADHQYSTTCACPACLNRQFHEFFAVSGAKIGDPINVRKPQPKATDTPVGEKAMTSLMKDMREYVAAGKKY